MTTTSTNLAARVAALEAKVADMSEKMERAEPLAAVRRGWEQAMRGEGKPAREVFKALKQKYCTPAK
jgi:hypothetical protein